MGINFGHCALHVRGSAIGHSMRFTHTAGRLTVVRHGTWKVELASACTQPLLKPHRNLCGSARAAVPEPGDQITMRPVQIAKPGVFRDFGGKLKFAGQVGVRYEEFAHNVGRGGCGSFCFAARVQAPRHR